MPGNALGMFNGDGKPRRSRAPPATLPPPATAAAGPACGFAVPRGLLPVLIYAGLAFALPFLALYVDIDYANAGNRAGAIAVSAGVALIVAYANCCCCWYNMMLFFHTALEVKVVELALVFAYAADTSATDAGLAITAAVVVIAHVVPFFLIDRVIPLAILAGAGIVVNTAVLVHLDTELLLLVSASSVALLVMTLIIVGVCETRTSILSLLLEAIRSGDCIKCGRYEL